MKIRKTIEVLCIIAFIVMICAFLIAFTNSHHEFDEVSYTVQSGDCLWYIANDYCPEGMNKWDYIHLVQDRNGLNGCTIYPGQTLIVLVEKGA